MGRMLAFTLIALGIGGVITYFLMQEQQKAATQAMDMQKKAAVQVDAYKDAQQKMMDQIK
ncbi:MAG: hypothetical protein ABL890_04080 [Candidatus Peribacteraceae bacterium]